MQVLMPIDDVDTNNIFFTEKRKNVILDGIFVKIIYSNEHFEMNGLHLLIRLHSLHPNMDVPDDHDARYYSGLRRVTPPNPIEKPIKYIELFDPLSALNIRQIELLCNVERDIVDNYIKLHAPNKHSVYNLKSQLMGGVFRYSRLDSPQIIANRLQTNYVLKISGIWETNCNVGITVKFIQF